jgi:L-asparaginase II
MTDHPCPPVLVQVVRDGVVESEHRGHAAVVAIDGTVVEAIGEDPVIYPRSTLKPFQALATLDLTAAAGHDLTPRGVAIACASHAATDDQVIEVAHLLALGGFDESALLCPPALPTDEAALLAVDGPAPIASNCSGKHAGFLLAQQAAGDAPERYLEVDSAVQRQVAERLVDSTGAAPSGPGVDGCGAPAWRLPLSAVARGYARLAAASSGALARVLSAMRSRPDLVGGAGSPDIELMQADGRVVAKRGAEAVFAAGASLPEGTIGVAVKIGDGGGRAAAPVAAALLRRAGARVPAHVLAPPVLGGGRPRGALTVHLPGPQ